MKKYTIKLELTKRQIELLLNAASDLGTKNPDCAEVVNQVQRQRDKICN